MYLLRGAALRLRLAAVLLSSRENCRLVQGLSERLICFVQGFTRSRDGGIPSELRVILEIAALEERHDSTRNLKAPS